MKAPPFAYQRAGSIADALRLLADAGPDAKLMAGGQSLLATLAFRLSEPSTLIDISKVPELKGITQTDAGLRIGAMTTHKELGASDLVRQHAPLLAEAVPLIAHPAIRTRGTIGGSIAFADPAAELPACVTAIKANIVVQGAAGERRIPADAFFEGLYTTALGEGELVTAIEVPAPKDGMRFAIEELVRRSGDYAMAGVAVSTEVTSGILADPRFVFFAVGDTPVLAKSAMAKAAGLPVTRETLETIGQTLEADLDPPSDLHGDGKLKTHWARVMLSRALRRIAGDQEAQAA